MTRKRRETALDVLARRGVRVEAPVPPRLRPNHRGELREVWGTL